MATRNIPLPPRHVVWIAFSVTALWMLVVLTGMRLPLLRTTIVDGIRVFVLFPLLLGIIIYLVMIRRWPNQPDTLYRMRMKQISTKKEKTKGVALTVFGFLFMTGSLAWTSIAFPAWATMLFASERYMHVYHIDDIHTRSGAQWSTLFDLAMTDAIGEKAALILSRSRYEKNRWRSGEDICLMGRTWMFGTIIDDSSRYLDRCGK